MGAEVCLDGVGTIAQPATAIISSLPGGSATGREIRRPMYVHIKLVRCTSGMKIYRYMRSV